MIIRIEIMRDWREVTEAFEYKDLHTWRQVANALRRLSEFLKKRAEQVKQESIVLVDKEAK